MAFCLWFHFCFFLSGSIGRRRAAIYSHLFRRICISWARCSDSAINCAERVNRGDEARCVFSYRLVAIDLDHKLFS
jgi:hypothetical protein